MARCSRLYNVGVYGTKILAFAPCLAFQGREIFLILSSCSGKSEYFYELVVDNCVKNHVIHAHIHSISGDTAEIQNAKFLPKADIPNIYSLYCNSLTASAGLISNPVTRAIILPYSDKRKQVTNHPKSEKVIFFFFFLYWNSMFYFLSEL